MALGSFAFPAAAAILDTRDDGVGSNSGITGRSQESLSCPSSGISIGYWHREQTYDPSTTFVITDATFWLAASTTGSGIVTSTLEVISDTGSIEQYIATGTVPIRTPAELADDAMYATTTFDDYLWVVKDTTTGAFLRYERVPVLVPDSYTLRVSWATSTDPGWNVYAALGNVTADTRWGSWIEKNECSQTAPNGANQVLRLVFNGSIADVPPVEDLTPTATGTDYLPAYSTSDTTPFGSPVTLGFTTETIATGTHFGSKFSVLAGDAADTFPLCVAVPVFSFVDMVVAGTATGTAGGLVIGGDLVPTTTITFAGADTLLEQAGIRDLYDLVVPFIEACLWLWFGLEVLQWFWHRDDEPID